ncbi:MAG: TonB-dependent receptor, partial [Bacteroidota bacterium]
MRNGVLALFCMILGLLVPTLLSAQDCELSLHGQVVQSENNQPLAYAKVLIEELGQTVLTDSNGYYRILNVCPGTYTLVCSHEACNHEVVVCELDHESNDFRFELEQHHFHLGEVEIRGVRKADETTQASVRLKGRSLQSQQAKSLAEAVATLPGVNILKTGATINKPIIHGLHSNRVLILNHGIRLEGQQWGSEHAPEIDPFLATQLQIIKGASSVRYGSGAVAGVILVEPPALPDSVDIGGKVHLQGFSNGRQGVASATLEGKTDGFPLRWRVQGTLKKGGNLHTPDYYLENTGISERNFSVALGTGNIRKGVEVFYNQFRTKIGVLSPAHVNSLLDIERALEREIPFGADTVGFTYNLKRPYQDIAHHLAKLYAFQRFESGKLSFTYAYQYNRRKEFDKHRPRGTDDNGEDIAELDFRIYTHTGELLWEQRPINGWKGSFGIFGIYQNNSLNGRPFIPNFISIGGEAFAIERYQQENWEVEVGVRYDYRYLHSAREESGIDIYSVQTFQNVSGTLGANLRLNEYLQLRANLGSAWRPPNVNEMFSDGLHHGAAAVEVGDSTLTPEQAIKGILALEVNNYRGWGGELSAYYQHFFNFIYKSPDGFERTIRGTFPLLVYTQNRARITGADVDLHYTSNFGLRWEAKASYLLADNLDTDEPLIFMPANWVESALQYTYATEGQWRNPFVKLGVRHVFEQKRVPQGVDILEPPAAYTLTHLSGGIRYLGDNSHWDFGFEVSNLFNVTYRDYLNRFRYYADDIGRNISLRINYQF